MRKAVRVGIHDGRVTCPRSKKSQPKGTCYGCERFTASNARMVMCSQPVVMKAGAGHGRSDRAPRWKSGAHIVTRRPGHGKVQCSR